MKRVYSREEVCMGCKLCEIACIVEHSLSKDIIKAYKEERPRTLSKARVEEEGPASFSIMCRHCIDPECLEACITGALYRVNGDGPVLVDQRRCVGCWMCVMACPYGSIERDSRNGRRVISKCDLCPDRRTPACVDACPNRALFYEER